MLIEPVFDILVEPVAVPDIDDVREDVVLRVPLDVPVVDTVTLVERLEDPLALYSAVVEILGDEDIVASIVRVSDAWADSETLTDGDELSVTPDSLGHRLPVIVGVREIVSVSDCVHVRKRVADVVYVFIEE